MQPTGSSLSVYTAVLIRKFLVSSLSDEEEADLAEWVEECPSNKALLIQTVKIYKEDLHFGNTPRQSTILNKELAKASSLEELFTS